MEGRGSLRQLHQQVSGLVSAPNAGNDWVSMKQRPPPPSLPPWSGSFGIDNDEGVRSSIDGFGGGWNNSKPNRGHPPKRLLVPIPPLERASQQFGEPQQEDRTEVDAQENYAIPKRIVRNRTPPLRSITTTSEPKQQEESGQENQRADEEHGDRLQEEQHEPRLATSSSKQLTLPRSRPSSSRRAPAEAKSEWEGESNQVEDSPESEAPSAGGFFRPWKKSDEQDTSRIDGANKWKVRALINPFAKRKAATKSAAPPPPPLNEEIDSPADFGRTLVGSPTVACGPGGRVMPRRPPTPSLSDLSNPPQHHPLRPRVLRSREGIADNLGQDDNDAKSCQTVEVPSQSSWKPKKFASVRSRQPNVQSSSGAEDSNNANDDAENGWNDDTSSIQSFQRRPQVSNKMAEKGKKTKSTMDALNEIKRKREERRQQQAEEKVRIKTELQEHGDDSGYKFRRLIHKFREALPLGQLPVKNQSKLPAASDPGDAAGLASSSSKLFVFIRKRPLSKKELKAKGYDILSCLFPQMSSTQLDMRLRRELICHEPKLKVDCSESLENHKFHFDGVFDEEQANEQVYASTVGPMIPYLLSKNVLSSTCQPSNLTIFAYGQTGSGKTYTMKSMYRQAAAAIFSRLEEICTSVSNAPDVSIGVSFYEIYMNTVNDLLNGRSRIQIMEDESGTVQLPGLKEVSIESADELLALVKRGEDSRATSANAVHDDSSRSHALMRVTVYAEMKQQRVMARLSMVDLAGSERACDTQSDRYCGSILSCGLFCTHITGFQQEYANGGR